MTNSSLYGTPIHNDSRTIVARSGHETTWHVLVTSWDRDISIVMLGLNRDCSMNLDCISVGFHTITTDSIESAMRSRLGRLEVDKIPKATG